MLRLGIPLLFVLIWSTGFIVAKAVLPHADLQLFLVARFSLTAIVMSCAAIIMGAPWPGARRAAPHVLAGALMQGIYLCASYWAITRGLAAGVMALLGALQPLFTALLAVSVIPWQLSRLRGSLASLQPPTRETASETQDNVMSQPEGFKIN
jgi:drug/metabolite transporter (DMT)-like permease